jgi:DNA-binding response OmpR family regulator
MPEHGTAPGARGCVLVVDDSRVARATVGARLAEVGVGVRDANGCAEAASVDLDHVDAALLDLELGDGTGVDVARALRATHAALPIAFLTSAPASRLAVEARELGPVFEKGPELNDAVAWALGRSRRF